MTPLSPFGSATYLLRFADSRASRCSAADWTQRLTALARLRMYRLRQREGGRSAFSVPRRFFALPIRDVEPVRGDRRPPLPQPIAATQMHSGTCEVYQLRWLGVSSDPGRRQPLPGPVRRSLRGWGLRNEGPGHNSEGPCGQFCSASWRFSVTNPPTRLRSLLLNAWSDASAAEASLPASPC